MNLVTTFENELRPIRMDADKAAVGRVVENDNRMIERALAGEETAFEDIYDRHKKDVARKASRFLDNRSEVEEVVQIVFIRAFRELGSFKGANEYSFRKWIAQITVNVCLNQLKSRSARIANLTDLFDENDANEIHRGLENIEEATIRRDLIQKLLAVLIPEDRVILQMMHANEMSAKEVAAVFGWTATRVRVRAFRARRSLDRIVKRLLAG